MTPHVLCSTARCASKPFWSIGRWVVIDFGLAGLFDRFEKSFGKRTTNVLLVLIGLAIAATCVRLVVTAISPVYFVLRDSIISSDGSRQLIDGILIGAVVLAGMILAALIAHAIEIRHKYYSITETAEENITNSAELIKRSDDGMRETKETLDDAQRVNQESKEILAELLQIRDKVSQLQEPTGNEEEKPR